MKRTYFQMMRTVVNSTDLGPLDKFLLLGTAWRMAQQRKLAISSSYGKGTQAEIVERFGA